jgi:hypothetical protein
VRAVPSLCEIYPGISLTTEEKVRKTLSQGNKNLSQGKKNLSQVKKILSQSTEYILTKTPTQTHILLKPTHTHTHTHTHTYIYIYITKQYKTTTEQIKTNRVQDIPKWNSHNIIKCPQWRHVGSGGLAQQILNHSTTLREAVSFIFLTLCPQEKYFYLPIERENPRSSRGNM